MEESEILEPKICPPPKFLPPWLFKKEWRCNKFNPPETKEEQIHLYHELVYCSRYGIMQMPGYEELGRVLKARIKELAVLLGYETNGEAQMEHVPQSILCEEYAEGNGLIPNSRPLCEERLTYLKRCLGAKDAAVLFRPAYSKNRAVLKWEIGALETRLNVPE